MDCRCSMSRLNMPGLSQWSGSANTANVVSNMPTSTRASTSACWRSMAPTSPTTWADDGLSATKPAFGSLHTWPSDTASTHPVDPAESRAFQPSTPTDDDRATREGDQGGAVVATAGHQI